MALHHSFLNSIVFVRSRTNELGKEKRVRDDFHFAHAAYRRHNERDHEEASPKTDLILGDLKLCERGHIRSLQSSLYVVVRRRRFVMEDDNWLAPLVLKPLGDRSRRISESLEACALGLNTMFAKNLKHTIKRRAPGFAIKCRRANN